MNQDQLDAINRFFEIFEYFPEEVFNDDEWKFLDYNGRTEVVTTAAGVYRTVFEDDEA